MKRKFAAIITAAASTASAASFSAMSAFAEESGSADGAAQQTGSPIFTLIIPLAIMFLLLYFMAIRPQKKKEQEMKDMQNSLQIGDEIVTTGGIVGIIVRTGEDTVVIETGGERNKLRIKTWAIAENVSAAERAKAAAPKKNGALASAAVVDDSDKKSKKKKKSDDTEE